MAREPAWWDEYKMYGEKMLSSVIWLKEEHATVVVWITMLGAQSAGRVIMGNPVSVAKRANVTLEEAEEAIRRLLADDPDRAMDGHDGRMIERITGGWKIIQTEDWV